MDALTARERLADLLVVDVREPHEWEAGRIEGSVHIPLGQLEERAGEIPPGSRVLAVCRTGSRSQHAAELLGARGIEAESLEGGLRRWEQEGLPVTTPGGAPGTVADFRPPGGLTPELEELRDLFVQVAFGLQERFGDREPTDEEAREFMLKWLVSRGASPEEARRILDG